MSSKIKFLRKIDKFLSSGSSEGYGKGSGYGEGDGFGDGYGYDDDLDEGYGYGHGSGYGSGFGSGFGSGVGSGFGKAFGSVVGEGYGSGFGIGIGIKSINSMPLKFIDNIPTLFKSIKENIAKGYILNKDFSLTKTYIVKEKNNFAHGKTIKEAFESLQQKVLSNMNIEEKIEKFVETFDKTKKYKGKLFFERHNILTGSCLQGRNSFIKNNNINLEDEFTVDEFIEKTQHHYNGDVIKKLKKYYEDKEVYD